MLYVKEESSYCDHYNSMYSLLLECTWNSTLIGTSCLLPRSFYEALSSTSSLSPCVARLTRLCHQTYSHDQAWLCLHYAIQPPPVPASFADSVHQVWHSALWLTTLLTSWGWDNHADIAARQTHLVHVIQSALTALTPNAVPDVSVANPLAPDLVRATYGPHLARLGSVKWRYYQHNVFYTPYGVGSNA
jgi:hypothetical protein